MVNKAGAYSPLMDAMAQKKLDPGVIAATNEAARRDTESLQARNALSNAPERVEREMLEPGLIRATNRAAGLVEAGNYVLSDLNNLDAGGEQYHYNVNAEGTVQFRSPISGKMITLKPSDTAPHKKKAYEAIMKQIAQAQKVSS